MRILTAIAMTLSLGPGSTCGPPTDEAVDRAVAAYEQVRKGFDRPDPHAGEAVKDLSVEEMTATQFERLKLIVDLAPDDVRAKFRSRLTSLAAARDASGAIAAVQLIRLIDSPGETATAEQSDAFNRERIVAILKAADHPGLPEAVKGGHATGVFMWMFFYGAADEVVNSGAMKRLAALVTDAWPVSALDDLLAFAEAATNPDARLDRASIDRVRAVATAVAQRVIEAPTTDEPTRDGLMEAIKAINSAAARGDLVGNPAPAIHFIWSSLEPAPKALADLRGRVVVLDFWATWCGPCVGAFPHMRELQARYKDAPVTIIGLTSLQGWILDPTAEDPAKRRIKGLSSRDEIAHLAAWSKRMDMTWPVAISEEKLFNPDYGIRGVPAMVIVDGKGVVRHAGVSPGDDDLTAKIDELVKELAAKP